MAILELAIGFHPLCNVQLNYLRFFGCLKHPPGLNRKLRLKSKGSSDPIHSAANSNVYNISLLQPCKDIRVLNQHHGRMLISGLAQNIILGTKLVKMYAECGSMEHSRRVFDKLYERDVYVWNVMIRGYAANDHFEEVLGLYYRMLDTGMQPDNLTFPFLLKACAALSALQEGKEIHHHIVRSGFEPDMYVSVALIDMYSKCGQTEDARQVFDKMSKRDVASWNAIIAGYAQMGHPKVAIALFYQMQRAGMKPNKVTIVSILPACTYVRSLQQGKCIHDYVIRNGFELDTSVGNSLIVMYAKCGDIEVARHVFEKMSKRDVISWNAMIAGYAQNEHPREALRLFHQMQLEGVAPDSVTMVTALSACANLGALEQGKWIHSHILRSGFEVDVFVGNSLIDMYAKCGTIEVAHQLFDKMPSRDAVSWNVMISVYVQNSHGPEALTLFHQMQLAGMMPDFVTMVSILSMCAHLGDFPKGKWVHSYIIRNGLECDVFVGNSLIDMYSKCGSMEYARGLFDRMSSIDVVSCNVMISGCTQNGYHNEALELFCEMQVVDVKSDRVTLVSVVSACAHLGGLQLGKCIHGYIIKSGFESDVCVGNSLVDMYAKCQSVESASQFFDQMFERDVISWNAMIAGHTHDGHVNEALMFFHQMQLVGMMPNSITMVTILSICTCLGALQQVECVHCYTITSGLDSDVSVKNSLVDSYAKCGSIDTACYLFDKMSQRNLVSWNAMIAGYAQNGHANEAFRLFHQMQIEDITPDLVTVASVLSACADLGSLQHGKSIHGYVIKSGFELDVSVANSLVDMYAKCGSIDIAFQLFDKMSERDVISWNIMISGYGMHGCGEDALALFSQMQQIGMKPDYITFTCILSACSHAGLVDEGYQCFTCMSRDYCMMPKVRHYACMVDLLGRAGHLDEAYDLIKKMPLEPDAAVWGALLGACRMHCNIELGEHVAEQLFNFEPENGGHYVLISNIYATAARWDDVAKVRKLMKQRRLNKPPGWSFIVINNRIHTFLVGNRSHPQLNKIYAMLETLSG